MGGRDEMIKASTNLQDLRRKIYAKAKADSVGEGGVSDGCTTDLGSSMIIESEEDHQSRKHSRLDRPHKPWCEAVR